MQSYKIWESAGKPRNGHIFDLKNKDRLSYKNEIRKAKTNENACISDLLHEALLHKSCTSFWKSWNNKLNKQKASKIEIEGGGSDNDVASKFASFSEKRAHPTLSNLIIA